MFRRYEAAESPLEASGFIFKYQMNNLHRSGFLMLMVKKLCKREIKVWIFVAGSQQMLYKNVFMFICGKLLGRFREVFFLLPRREQ